MKGESKVIILVKNKHGWQIDFQKSKLRDYLLAAIYYRNKKMNFSIPSYLISNKPVTNLFQY